VRIISRKTLQEFWRKHPDVEQPLQAWFHDVKHANWQSPADIKAVHRNASFLGRNRVVFNIKGNKYRIVTAVQYDFGIVFIRFIGTYKDYDTIDAKSI
jgi:mRNA interferase HigB